MSVLLGDLSSYLYICMKNKRRHGQFAVTICKQWTNRKFYGKKTGTTIRSG